MKYWKNGLAIFIHLVFSAYVDIRVVTPGGWYASSHARGIDMVGRIHIKRKWLLDDYIFQQPHDWFESYKTSLFMESGRWVAKVVQMEYIHLTIHGVSDVKGIFNLITSRFSYSLSMVCARLDMHTNHLIMGKSSHFECWYRWWKKSCTTWDV